jgi:E3 ubiquitin-protein ligase RNF181
MAGYFDEHDCEPLGENERPNEQLMLARLLLDSGIATALDMNFSSLSAANNVHNLPPPVSKQWLKNELPKHCFNESDRIDYKCPICLVKFAKSSSSSSAIRLPECGHSFHLACLTRWLDNTSSCPMCRAELPTDNTMYEEFKRQKKREKVRELELADLHNSMFS